MYNFKEVENKWRNYWEENKTFKTDTSDFTKPKYYALDMFPYPSGLGLHAGHVEGYTATDIMSRYKRMKGFNVLHPIGFDSFGLPAEQFAIKTGKHPNGFTQKNIEYFTKQLKYVGLSYDWDRVISSHEPSYYKWTQWIFKRLYEDNLAKEIDMPVNWCEELGTVLANDEVIDGKSERGGYPVVRKNMKQWVIDIPKYADRLLDGLNEVDWPLSTKEMQRNWIGKSEGVEVEIKLTNNDTFKIYTTCIETIYGITFFVIAPDGKIIEKLMPLVENKEEVQKYIDETARKSNMDRTELNKGKTGVEVKGIKAINPVNNREVPIYLGDFVLGNYGTGAVMAVPSHDQRDFEFAKYHNIPMIQVIDGRETETSAFEKMDYLGKGCKLINSEEFTGLTVEEAKEAITNKLISENIARKTVNYRIREWIFARQRYWGEPIPIVHMEDGTSVALKDEELPLILPELDDYKGKNGKAPLESATEWKNVVIDGKKGVRETSTMPGSAASSWYFLRYIDPKNDNELVDKKLEEHWMPVDLYVGGPEHAVGHLLYSRMWNNYLYDKNIITHKEPFNKLVHPGMILGSNGLKMGKRYPEFAVDPIDVAEKYGADTLRLYEMFMGPIEAEKPWNEDGVNGAKKFIDKVFRLLIEDNKISDEENKNLEKIYHQTIKKVEEDYEKMSFNTAISQMMIFMNQVQKEEKVPREYVEGFIKIFNPICPFVTEEMWSILGHNNTISYEEWPKYDESKIKEDTFDLIVQVNGKVRGKINVSSDTTKEEMEKLALEIENVKKYIDGKNIEKIIVVPKKLVSIVIK